MPELSELLSDPTLSSYREQVLEQIFCSDLLQAAWRANLPPLEIDRPFVDRAGYDLVISAGSLTRHVQLKGVRVGGRKRTVPVQRALQDKPNPCVVLLMAEEVEHRIVLSYRLFPAPGQPFDFATFPTARHPRRNAAGVRPERAGVIDLPLSALEPATGGMDADAVCRYILAP
jgi:hypothetical protein